MSIVSTELRSPGIWLVRQECHHPRVDCGRVEGNEPARFVLTRCGSFALHVGKKQYLARPGNAIFVRRNTEFRISHPERFGRDCCTDLRLDEATLDSLDMDANVLCREFGHDLSFQRLHMQVLSNLGGAGAINDPDAGEVLLDLLACLLRRANAGGDRTSRNAGVANKVARVQEAILGNPDQNLGIDALAHIADCSPYYLCRIFRMATGQPLRHFRLQHRLGGVLGRLAEGEQDLTTLACEFGFNSHSHMTQMFRQLVGQSPSAVRQEFRRHDIDATGLQLRRLLGRPH